jgi:hypothetical protein
VALLNRQQSAQQQQRRMELEHHVQANLECSAKPVEQAYEDSGNE